MEVSFMWFGKYIRSVFQTVAIVSLVFQIAQQAFAAAPPTYIFSTFTGDHANEMLLRIYTSADGTNFTLYSDSGYGGPTGSLRDPSIMKYNGRYYVVFTAPPYNNPYANQNFVGLAWSTNLVDWHTMPSIYTTNIPGVKLSWAPEWVVGNSGLPEFTVNCSSASSDLRPYLYTATSSGLTNWSGPVDIGIGSMHLDTQILKVGDTWHCFTKSNFLQQATAPSITGPWNWLPAPADWVNLEGPCAVQLTDGSWVMFVDPMYDVAQYMTSPDLTNWSPLIYLPGPGNSIIKHGTVIRDDAFNLPPTGLHAMPGNSAVNLQWNAFNGAASYNLKRSSTAGGPYTLIANVTGTSFTDSNVTNNGTYYYVLSINYGGSESPHSTQVSATVVSNTVSLVHRYSFSETSGTNVADSVGGSAWDGTLPNGGTFGSGQLALSAAGSQYVQLPAGILSNYTAVTIEAWVTFPSQLPNNCFLFGFGNSSGGSGNSYIFCQPKQGRIAITPSNYNGEQDTAPNPSGNWSLMTNLHVTAVFNPPQGSLSLYTNGVLVAQNTSVTIPLSSVNDLFSYIGRSLYNDPYIDVNLDEFRIYNGALQADDIAASDALGPNQVLPSIAPGAPTGLKATPEDARVVLRWNAATNATGYNVKRALASGGPYSLIVTNTTALTWTDTGLTNGTSYFYVVSATNYLGESTNSAQASARPVSTTSPKIKVGINGSKLQLNWPADHTGWRLQMSTNLNTTNWQDVSGAGAGDSISVPPTNDTAFIRMIYPGTLCHQLS